MQKQKQFESIFGKLPKEEEIKRLREAYLSLEEAYSRTYAPFTLIDREAVKALVLKAKKNLGELV